MPPRLPGCAPCGQPTLAPERPVGSSGGASRPLACTVAPAGFPAAKRVEVPRFHPAPSPFLVPTARNGRYFHVFPRAQRAIESPQGDRTAHPSPRPQAPLHRSSDPAPHPAGREMARNSAHSGAGPGSTTLLFARSPAIQGFPSPAQAKPPRPAGRTPGSRCETSVSLLVRAPGPSEGRWAGGIQWGGAGAIGSALVTWFVAWLVAWMISSSDAWSIASAIACEVAPTGAQALARFSRPAGLSLAGALPPAA